MPSISLAGGEPAETRGFTKFSHMRRVHVHLLKSRARRLP
jgi:hypothetical protein